MIGILPALFLAAALELGGDAAIRYGLVRAAWRWVVLGGAMLVAYGLALNANRSVDFGRLMGVYIALFFLMSQLIGLTIFGDRPSATLVVGGTLIVAGGLVIQAGMP